MAQTYTVRIKNGTKSVKRCRIFLWWKKYTCIRRENSRVYYEKKAVNYTMMTNGYHSILNLKRKINQKLNELIEEHKDNTNVMSVLKARGYYNDDYSINKTRVLVKNK